MSDSENSPNPSVTGWMLGVCCLGLVIGVGVAVGTARFVKARSAVAKASCISNLKQIDGAVQQWALENSKTTNDTYSISNPALLGYLRGSILPACPDGGRYLPGTNVGDYPRCTIGGSRHSL